jgi:hypothetical protein
MRKERHTWGNPPKAVDKNHEIRLSPWERDGIGLTYRPRKADAHLLSKQIKYIADSRHL